MVDLKRILISILILSVLLIACTGDIETKVMQNLGKILENSTGYEAEAEVKITMDDKESTYKLRERYINKDEIIIEILEPKESNGITIEYRGDKILLNNSSIDQSISLNTMKGINKGLLFGEIFEDRDLIESIKEEKVHDIDYYVIDYIPESENKYNHRKLIYLNKKDFQPYRMIILDENDEQRVLILYKDFKFNSN